MRRFFTSGRSVQTHRCLIRAIGEHPRLATTQPLRVLEEGCNNGFPDPSTELLGTRVEFPVLVAPWAFYEKFRVECEKFGSFVSHEDIAEYIPIFGPARNVEDQAGIGSGQRTASEGG